MCTTPKGLSWVPRLAVFGASGSGIQRPDADKNPGRGTRQKEEERIPISSVDDLFTHSDRIRESLKYVM